MPSRKLPTPSTPPAAFATLLFCFFLSGAAGLIYQVAWTKSLALLFGHTTYAVSTVLAIFLGGLAIGSAILGKSNSRLARVTNDIAFYAYLELAIAATGFLSFLGLAAVRSLYLSHAPAFSHSSAVLLCLRIFGSAIVLLPPAFLMGGTFPILIRGVTQNRSELNQRLSRFYAINTLGAVAGTLAAGFFLLPKFGLRQTIILAALLNILAAGLAWKFSRKLTVVPEDLPPAPLPTRSAKKAPTPTAAISTTYILAAFTLVGATAISYEISWTRLLATMVGSSTYAYTLMLATFLAGIVAGSLLFEKWSRRRTATLTTFSHTQTATALAALLFLFLFRELPSCIPPILRLTNNSFSGLLLAQFAVSAAAMFPAALIFGFNFPLVTSLIARNRPDSTSATSDVGRAYAANTAGAILAALLVGFLLLPKIGSFHVVALTAIFNMVLAIFLLTRTSPIRIPLLGAQAAALVLLAFVGFSSHFYDRALANFSAVLYGSYHPGRLTLDEIANTEDVVFFEDGLNATITVTRSEDYVALKTNGKVDASTIDTSTQLLLGHLGGIFHPHPRRVLIIGFGGGMTASAVAKYPDVESIDCIEIEPAVLHAAKYLDRLNRGVLQDPRLHLIYDDARNFLQTVPQPYDLIISEPSNPWIAGVATLYTTEFYATVRAHLAPGGMFVQWVQAYGLQPTDFRMILATLAPHFPNLSLWRSADRDFLLLARADTSPLSFARARQLWNNPGLQSDFEELHLPAAEGWPAYFRLADPQLRQLATGAQLNTDNQTLLEFSAPRSLLYDPEAQTLTELVGQAARPLLPPDLNDAEQTAALSATAAALAEMENPLLADYLPELDKLGTNAPTAVLWGRLAQMRKQPAEAISRFTSTDSPGTNLHSRNYWLGQAYQQIGNLPAAHSAFSAAIIAAPRDPRTYKSLVDTFRATTDWSSAIVAQKQLLASPATSLAADYCELGDLYLRAGDRRAAVSPLEEGLRRDYYSYLCRRDLGELQRAAGRNAEARDNLEFVVRYFPEGDAKAYASLALTYVALGRRSAAETVLQKGKRIFPQDVFLQRFQLPN